MISPVPRFLWLALACTGGLTCVPLAAADDEPAPRGSGLAVLPFRVASTVHGGGREIGIDLQDSLHTALTPVLRGKSVTLIERFRLDEVLQENKISDTGVIDPAEAVRVGGKAGARYILLGTITQLDTLRESEVKESRKYPEKVPRGLQKALGKIRLPGIFESGRNRGGEEDTITVISVEARIVSISAADGEASFKAEGTARGKRANYAAAVANAAEALARDIGATIQKNGRVAQAAGVAKTSGVRQTGGSKVPPRAVAPEPSPSAGPVKLEGRVLSADSDEEVGVKLQKEHGLKEGAKYRMRWLQPLNGDVSVRKTKASYIVEVLESDVGGVILKVLSTERGTGLPGKDAMIVLEPVKG